MIFFVDRKYEVVVPNNTVFHVRHGDTQTVTK